MLVAVIIALKYTNFGLCVTCHVFFLKSDTYVFVSFVFLSWSFNKEE